MDIVFSLAQKIHVLHYGSLLDEGAPDEGRYNQTVVDVDLALGEGQCVALLGRNGVRKSITMKTTANEPRANDVIKKRYLPV